MDFFLGVQLHFTIDHFHIFVLLSNSDLSQPTLSHDLCIFRFCLSNSRRMLQQVQQGLVHGLELAAPEGVAPGQQGLHIQHPRHAGEQFRIGRCDQPADDGAVQIEILR